MAYCLCELYIWSLKNQYAIPGTFFYDNWLQLSVIKYLITALGAIYSVHTGYKLKLAVQHLIDLCLLVFSPVRGRHKLLIQSLLWNNSFIMSVNL